MIFVSITHQRAPCDVLPCRDVTGKVDLKWESANYHVELSTMADNLLTGAVGLSKRENGDEIKIDMMSVLGQQMGLQQGANEGYYPSKSFSLFHVDSTFRRLCFRIVTSWLFAFFSWVLAVGALLAFIIEQRPPEIDLGVPWTVVEFVAFIFLGFEALLKCVSYGVISSPGSFVRASVFNVSDVIVFISYWIEMAESGRGSVSQFTIRPMRCFRILLPLRQFTVFGGLTAIFMSLKFSFISMLTIVLFLALFAFGFAVFGVTFYEHSFSRRCVSDAASAAIMFPPRYVSLPTLMPLVAAFLFT